MAEQLMISLCGKSAEMGRLKDRQIAGGRSESREGRTK